MSRKFASSNYFRKKNPALHKAKPELFLHYKFHYSLYNKYRRAREQRNRKKTLFTICHDQCYNESRRTGNDPACRCCQDCRKCHSCKTCIWHIVQKGFYKRTGALPFEKDQWKHTNQICYTCHHQNIQIYIRFHLSLLPPFPLFLFPQPGRNVLPTLLPAMS